MLSLSMRLLLGLKLATGPEGPIFFLILSTKGGTFGQICRPKVATLVQNCIPKVQKPVPKVLFAFIYNSSKRINIKSLISYIHRHIKPYINTYINSYNKQITPDMINIYSSRYFILRRRSTPQ